MKHRRRVWLFPSLVILAALTGCGSDDPIRVYEATATPRPQTLETPSTWRRVPLTKMDQSLKMVYRFQAGSEDDPVRISVSTPGGTLLANVNRWRGQVGLPTIEEAKLDSELTSEDASLKIGGFKGHYLEMVTPEAVAAAERAKPPSAKESPHEGLAGFAMAAQRKPGVREAIYVAIFPQSGSSHLVFHLKASPAAAELEKATFKKFADTALRALLQSSREPRSPEPADGN